MSFTRRTRPGILAAAMLALTALLAGCGGSSSDPGTLTVYNAQHASLTQAWADGFTKKTGIKVQVRQGSDFELANQILAEGQASPADVFITENSPALSLLSSKGRLAKLDQATLDEVPAQFRSSAGDWIGNAARSTVLLYNPSLVGQDQLPHSILDLAQPQWQGKVAIAPSGGDFQAIVSAVFAVDGDAAAQQWLAGLKRNAKIYQGNVPILQAVNTGQVATGITYHYYWYRDQAEGGHDSANARLDFFGSSDAGAFVSVSGAGVVASTKHAKEAQEFVAYMSSTQGQQILADGDSMQYTVVPAVAPNPKLKPLSELDPPVVDLNSLNGPKVIAAMQHAGLL